MSHVVLARHRETRREYAIKILDKSFVLRNRLTDSVHLERKLLDALDDPCIVHLEFTFQDAHSLYLGLQCCPHGTPAPLKLCSRLGSKPGCAGELFDQIARSGKLSLADTRFYAAELVLMLRYLRSKQASSCKLLTQATVLPKLDSLQVVHRDLKPENLLFNAQRHLQLTDFGSAKDLSDTAAGAQKRDGANLKGTADYISPEVRPLAGTLRLSLQSQTCLGCRPCTMRT